MKQIPDRTITGWGRGAVIAAGLPLLAACLNAPAGDYGGTGHHHVMSPDLCAGLVAGVPGLVLLAWTGWHRLDPIAFAAVVSSRLPDPPPKPPSLA